MSRHIEVIRDFLLLVKRVNPCPCGESDSSCLDFHHLGRKSFDISDSKLRRTITMEQLTAELEQCTVLCANCHRKFHAGRLTHFPALKPLSLHLAIQQFKRGDSA